MPGPAPHPCVVPGCAQLITRGRRCRQHAVTAEHARPNYAWRRWYRTPRWSALRARVLRDQAYRCAGCGEVVAGLEVDHIVRHEGVPARFWDRANLQALCRRCHQRKTQRGE
jgi:5-methylcytosine-specific restriction protein A